MKCLELFAGTKSFSNVANKLGYKTFTSDNDIQFDVDYLVDVLKFDFNKVPFVPDIIWASPPCEGFSVASIGTHWDKDNTPKTLKAELSVKLVEKTVGIIEHFKTINPNLIWYIENPRGKLRKLGLIKGNRHTVTYCQYGDTRMKPTDIWTNDSNWQPKPICKNGMPCHTPAPRGSKTGTQGIQGYRDRSIVPKKLCKEILKSGNGDMVNEKS